MKEPTESNLLGMMSNSQLFAEITIVIPVKNRADVVMDTLASIREQTVRPRRVVLVDDHSTDGTPEVLNEFARNASAFDVVVLASAEHGACSARNRGLEAAETEWTMFFDSDDVMAPAHLEKAIEAARINPDADIIGWDVERIDLEGRKRVLKFETKDIDRANIMHGSMATQRYMARTDLFRRAGGWNENQPIWNDIELGVRLLNLHPTIAKAGGAPTVTIRARRDSITGARWSDRRADYRLAIDNLRIALGDNRRSWLKLKAAILAADIAREIPDEGSRFYHEIEGRGLATRLPYLWRRMGLRGAARVFKPLFNKKGEPKR